MQIKPRKSLGQNFLIDPNIRRKIVAMSMLKPSDTVLEIGTGKAELTKMISEQVKSVYTLEVDKRLYTGLASELKCYPNIEAINADILKFDLSKLARAGKPLKVIGNIPYYISSPIIEHLFKHKESISDIYLTVQKEFALRAAALPGSKIYGSFSCFVRYFSEPEILFNISKGCFRPQPKVDSVFLRLSIRGKPPVKVNDEGALFSVIRAAFNKRRKTLRNSLEKTVPESLLSRFFAQTGIAKDIRPEALSLEDFAAIANLKTTKGL